MNRIPLTVAEFVTYLKNTNTFLKSDDPLNPGHKQWERLGLTSAEQTDWDNSNTAAQDLWAKYSNADLRTLSVMRELRTLRLNWTKGARGIVNRIASSAAATQQDATVFNFVLVKKQPTKQTVDITELVIAGIKRIGSGEFGIECRFEKDTKRPSLLPKADGVEYSFKITNTQPADPATVDLEGEGFRLRFVSKAKFVFKSGTANKGKYLIIAFRWVNSKYPELAGPWCEAQIMVII